MINNFCIIFLINFLNNLIIIHFLILVISYECVIWNILILLRFQRNFKKEKTILIINFFYQIIVNKQLQNIK